MRLKCLALVALAGLTLAGCGLGGGQDAAFGKKVRAYLMAHPEVIRDAVQKLQENEQASANLKVKAALTQNRQALERDPRDFVANPNGKITVTEFYDYRCAHCINAAPAVLGIIKANPDVRFVFKEMPIFGDVSEQASRAAIAVKKAGGDYVGFYRTAMSTRGLDSAGISRIARQYGVDPAAAQASPARDAADAQLVDVHRLASTLNIDGTPTFIIGDTIIPGEDMDAVRAAIAATRTAGRKTS
jgi:protein-disulfide isomerase